MECIDFDPDAGEVTPPTAILPPCLFKGFGAGQVLYYIQFPAKHAWVGTTHSLTGGRCHVGHPCVYLQH